MKYRIIICLLACIFSANMCFARVGGSLDDFRKHFAIPKVLVEKSAVLITQNPDSGQSLYQFDSIVGRFTCFILADTNKEFQNKN